MLDRPGVSRDLRHRGDQDLSDDGVVLGLGVVPDSEDDNRRVLAVLALLGC